MFKKILFLSLLIILLPNLAVAADFQLVVNNGNDLVVKPADLGKNVSVPFKVKGSAQELAKVKKFVLSVKDTRADKVGFHFQAGDYVPDSGDYEDGEISGVLLWDTQPDSAEGWHPIEIYLCSTTDKNACIRDINPEIIAICESAKSVYVGESAPEGGDEPLPGGGEPGPGDGTSELLPRRGQFSSIWDVLIRVVNILLIFAGVVAVGAVIIGGYQYITSSGMPDRTQVAKSTLTYAIIGLVLVIIAFVALQYIFDALGIDTGVIWF